MCLSPFYPLCPPQVLVLKMQRLIHSVDFVWLLSAPGVIMLAAVPCCVQNQGPAESLKFCSCHLKEWEAVRSFGLRSWSWWPDVVSLPFPAPFLCVTLRSLIAWGAAGGRSGPRAPLWDAAGWGTRGAFSVSATWDTCLAHVGLRLPDYSVCFRFPTCTYLTSG